MKGNPKRRLQRLIISSKNRHRGTHLIYTVTATMGSSSLSPPLLYTHLYISTKPDSPG